MKTNEKLNFLVCQNCNGKGFVNNVRCSQCGGYGVVLILQNKILYWGKAIDRLHIFSDKIIGIINKVINLLLLLFGLFGIFIIIYVAYKTSFNNLLVLEYWRTASYEKLI